MRIKLIVAAFVVSFFAACGSGSDAPLNNAASSNAQPAAASQKAATPTPSSSPSPASTSAADIDAKTVVVQFPAGATEASYAGTFSGYGVVDYKLDARAGQDLTAEILQSDGNKAIMTVMKDGLAVDSDSSMVQGWTGTLPTAGTYVIRIGQMRNDARRGTNPVKFGLRIQIVNP